MEKIDVLDHGFVRLVDHMGSDLSIVRAARVSYDAAWRAGENEGSDRRLIHYLWRNQHTTPFEAVTFTFEVKAPIFVFRQWHRHRTWSYNELSARYRELPEEVYIPDPKIIGVQSTSNKQGRQPDRNNGELVRRRTEELRLVGFQFGDIFSLYKNLIENGWPRELARIILPLGTYSYMFASVDLRNLFHFLTLRTDEHAQYEIQQYAAAILSLIREVVPAAVSAWETYPLKNVSPS